MPKFINGSPILIEGQRSWINYEEFDYSSDDFLACGSSFDLSGNALVEMIGYGKSRLFSIRNAVDHALAWFLINRIDQA